MKIILKYFICFTSLFVFLSCKQDTQEVFDEGAFRTVIFYIIADNDLSYDSQYCLQEIENGYSESGVNVIVYIDSDDKPPMLLKICENKKAIVLKTYEELNSCSPSQICSVLSEIVELFPAKSYGLVFWSHGTSWMPSGVKLKSFGNDQGMQIDLIDLSNAIPIHFEFIIFDACLMGSVEVAFELKDKSDFIIASSTEILSSGFPYQLILPELTKKRIDLKYVCESYFDYYNELSGEFRSATVSLINTSFLDSLSIEFKSIVENSKYDAKNVNRLAVQRLDCFNEQYCFDLLDFVEKAFPDVNVNKFAQILEKVVIFKNSTPRFINLFDINKYSGMSSYIYNPIKVDLIPYYKKLKWYKSSGLKY